VTSLNSKAWKDRSRLLEGLAPSEQESILKASKPHQFPGKSVILDQGSPANNLYLLTFGRARNFFITADGRKILLNWLSPGDIFGADTGLVKHAFYLFGTETVTDSDALVWDRLTIRGLVAQHPRLLDNGLLIAAKYFIWFLMAHEALTCHAAPQRLAHVLVRLAKGIGQEVSGGFELDVTNEELAHSANVTLFTVSRLMSHWHRQGALEKGRGKVLLRSPERLFKTYKGCGRLGFPPVNAHIACPHFSAEKRASR
jgi:CRP-like cAMP-binding protein